jgi:glycosyltransferase involved in cell wall biosynthesis
MDMWPDVAEALGMIRPRSFTARALRRCAASMYGVADHVVSLGWTMSDRLGRYGVYQDRVSAVHNWVPGESVRALDPGTCGLTGSPAREGAFLVMYSGNMGMAHEFDTILDAAGLLQGEGAVRFEFVGGGRRRREVQEGAAARGLRNVAFMESRPMGDLAILLGSADAHLVSMRGEATGMLVPSKIYGILAAGRPALFVGPSQCEVSDLIGASGGGARFSPGDAHGLADLIRTLSADRAKARRLGEKGRAYYDRFLGRDRSVAAIVAVVTGSSAPARAPLAAGLFRPQTEAAVPSETPVCEAQG